MKKQRLLKKQQQAQAGGPELTEAEVRVTPVVALLYLILRINAVIDASCGVWRLRRRR
jgi:hypothetical protein